MNKSEGVTTYDTTEDLINATIGSGDPYKEAVGRLAATGMLQGAEDWLISESIRGTDGVVLIRTSTQVCAVFLGNIVMNLAKPGHSRAITDIMLKDLRTMMLALVDHGNGNREKAEALTPDAVDDLLKRMSDDPSMP